MKMPFDFTLIENSFIEVCKVYEVINKEWKIEIEEEGRGYSIDHQDSYKFAYEEFYNFKYKEIYKLTESDKFLDELKLFLIPLLEENITLYAKHKDLFNKHDRKKIQINFYRNKVKSNLSDSEISEIIDSCIDDLDRFEYYSSTFYHEVGYISENFHYYIAAFSKQLLRDINENFKNYIPYNSKDLKTNKKQIFPLKLLIELWEYGNANIFESISDFDFCKELNFFHTIQKIKIKDDQVITFCYVINKLKKTIKDTKVSEVWENEILESLNINSNTYKSKKTYLKQKDSSIDSKAIAKQIDDIFKPFL